MLGIRTTTADYAEQDAAGHTNLSNLPGGVKKENAVVQRGSMTVGPGAKGGSKGPVGFKTPFRKGNDRKLPQTGVKPIAIRVLGDKTPLPNRQNLMLTPLPRSGSKKVTKPPLPSLLDEAKGSSPSQPPSTNRKKLRAPRSSSKSFETPITKGDHWNVSDLSADIAGTSLEEVKEAEAEVDDFSEPEYMPPTAIVPPYEPLFELPNYKELGERLLQAAFSYPVDDEPVFDKEYRSDEILKDAGWSASGTTSLVLPELEEDDPYLKSKVSSQSLRAGVPPPAVRPRTTSTRSILPSNARAAMSSRLPTVSRTKSSNVPLRSQKPPFHGSSTSRPLSRPATVATTASVRSHLSVPTTRRGAISAATSVSRSAVTVASRPHTVAATSTRTLRAGPTAAGTRDTKVSLARALARVKHLGVDVTGATSKRAPVAMAGSVKKPVLASRPLTTPGTNVARIVVKKPALSGSANTDEDIVLRFDDIIDSDETNVPQLRLDI